MKDSYLEVTFRHGQPLAAYLYLPRKSGEKSFRTAKLDRGMIVDFNRQGKPIGIELTVPTKVTLTDLNQVLSDLGLPPISAADLEPLRAA